MRNRFASLTLVIGALWACSSSGGGDIQPEGTPDARPTGTTTVDAPPTGTTAPDAPPTGTTAPDAKPTGSGPPAACYGQPGQTCTGADAYASCLDAHCSAGERACFGDGFASGDFSGGACAAFVACNVQCACGDTACRTACVPQLTADCQTCLTSLGTCEEGSGCTAPVCTGGSTPDAAVGGGGDACSKLAACCPRFPGSNGPAGCNQIVALGNVPSCQSALDGAGALCD